MLIHCFHVILKDCLCFLKTIHFFSYENEAALHLIRVIPKEPLEDKLHDLSIHVFLACSYPFWRGSSKNEG